MPTLNVCLDKTPSGRGRECAVRVRVCLHRRFHDPLEEILRGDKLLDELDARARDERRMRHPVTTDLETLRRERRELLGAGQLEQRRARERARPVVQPADVPGDAEHCGRNPALGEQRRRDAGDARDPVVEGDGHRRLRERPATERPASSETVTARTRLDDAVEVGGEGRGSTKSGPSPVSIAW